MKSYHSYAVEDRVGFADWCNRILGKEGLTRAQLRSLYLDKLNRPRQLFWDFLGFQEISEYFKKSRDGDLRI